MILLHNMMVEACLQKDEVEDGRMYNAIDTTIDHELNVHDAIGGVDDAVIHMDADSDGNVNEVLDDVMWDNSSKFEIVHKCWEELYDFDGSIVLREEMKCHLYRHKFGEGALTTSHDIVEGYNPLVI